ncbi:unnamed protein product [Protopolystoma xenopodis]|uniref:Uncharacterized protein n=1 Tax=Protopolystoma xenopodis TaxID=117903 RepID=A0A3S5CHZ9_9PLAT|nr:unnamed protein product [Protopolystoma xenopodis]
MLNSFHKITSTRHFVRVSLPLEQVGLVSQKHKDGTFIRLVEIVLGRILLSILLLFGKHFLKVDAPLPTLKRLSRQVDPHPTQLLSACLCTAIHTLASGRSTIVLASSSQRSLAKRYLRDASPTGTEVLSSTWVMLFCRESVAGMGSLSTRVSYPIGYLRKRATFLFDIVPPLVQPTASLSRVFPLTASFHVIWDGMKPLNLFGVSNTFFKWPSAAWFRLAFVFQ